MKWNKPPVCWTTLLFVPFRHPSIVDAPIRENHKSTIILRSSWPPSLPLKGFSSSIVLHQQSQSAPSWKLEAIFVVTNYFLCSTSALNFYTSRKIPLVAFSKWSTSGPSKKRTRLLRTLAVSFVANDRTDRNMDRPRSQTNIKWGM